MPGIFRELLNEIQNRPRLFNFRNQPAPEMPEKEQPKKATSNEPVVLREQGQYPGIHPEYENVSNPFEWHQALVTQKMAKAKEYNEQQTVSSPYNIPSEYSYEPAKSDSGSSRLPSNKYNRNVLFR